MQAKNEKICKKKNFWQKDTQNRERARRNLEEPQQINRFQRGRT